MKWERFTACLVGVCFWLGSLSLTVAGAAPQEGEAHQPTLAVAQVEVGSDGRKVPRSPTRVVPRPAVASAREAAQADKPAKTKPEAKPATTTPEAEPAAGTAATPEAEPTAKLAQETAEPAPPPAAEEQAKEAETASVPEAEEPSEPEATTGERRISINLASRSLALYEGSKKIRLYPIGPGKPSTPTPVGYFEVREKEVNPTWIDPSDPEFAIPSGEANPLGYRWIGFKGNYGIHGTNRPHSVGFYVSNGCIRMFEQNVEELFDMIEVGTPIEITYNRVVVEKTTDGRVALYIYPDGYGEQPLDVPEVAHWLKGYGVENFISDAEIAEKIKASDGEPTFVGKPYDIEVNGKLLKDKAVVQDGLTYLPAIGLAEATGVELGWDADNELLTSTYAKARGFDKKDMLYALAEDVPGLYRLKGGLAGKEGFVYESISHP